MKAREKLLLLREIERRNRERIAAHVKARKRPAQPEDRKPEDGTGKPEGPA